jgi:hypothetical protein
MLVLHFESKNLAFRIWNPPLTCLNHYSNMFSICTSTELPDVDRTITRLVFRFSVVNFLVKGACVFRLVLVWLQSVSSFAQKFNSHFLFQTGHKPHNRDGLPNSQRKHINFVRLMLSGRFTAPG